MLFLYVLNVGTRRHEHNYIYEYYAAGMRSCMGVPMLALYVPSTGYGHNYIYAYNAAGMLMYSRVNAFSLCTERWHQEA